MIHPRNDMVLIERLEEQEVKSHIVIPDIAKIKGIRGQVVAVGPGKWIEGINGGKVRRPVDVKPGEIVYFNSKWDDLSGSHYSDDKLEDRKLHLVMEGDIYLKENNAR